MFNLEQVVYILDQVRALEAELLLRIKQQGLTVKPQILVVSFTSCKGVILYIKQTINLDLWKNDFVSWQVTRLIPDARGTKCDQELEPIIDTKHSHILRVPFVTEKGILRQWVSRFDIYPYLERFTQACAFV